MCGFWFCLAGGQSRGAAPFVSRTQFGKSTLLRSNDMATNVSKFAGIALATAVAGMFTMAATNAFAAGDEAKVKCENSSSCKGQGACKQATNSCKGQNA